MSGSYISNPDEIFDELLKFLLREKRVLDYMDSSIRATGNADRSSLHSVAGSLTPDSESQKDSGDLMEAIKRL